MLLFSFILHFLYLIECNALQHRRIAHGVRPTTKEPPNMSQALLKRYPYKTPDGKITWQWCTGTIVHKHFILTAGHCINDAENIKGGYGSFDKSSLTPFTAKSWYKYDKDNKVDVGLIETNEEIKIDAQFIVSFDFWSLNDDLLKNNYKTTNCGWGLTGPDQLANQLTCINYESVKEKCKPPDEHTGYW